ncbi:FixH family protein [Nitrosophilus labii]|uniref:FixH family protein n=1 Tax=Nitrosophilus labii TaxID=2706014 RepID=UPI0016571FAD|nr:FixH family protein [Nitrosophilus labii]
MRLTTIILTMFLVVSSYAAGFQKHVKYRGFNVEFTSTKPLTSGENSLTLKISKKGLNPKEVKVKFFMPAMPGMPYMESFAKVKPLKDGEYLLNVKFPMRGTWQVHVFVTDKNGKKYRVKTSVSF